VRVRYPKPSGHINNQNSLGNLCAAPTGITRLRVFANAVIVDALLQHHPHSPRPDRPHSTADAGIDRKIGRRLNPPKLGGRFIPIGRKHRNASTCVAPNY
jgi:hypothetical protein